MRARGFTLIELVVVIVLLGIVSVTMAFLFTGTVGGYIDTARRMDSATAARIALDRMGRELREAMPLSVRLDSSGKCIQFLPILSSSVYTSFPIATTTISVLDFPQPVGTPLYAAIYPINAGELYGMIAMEPVASISSVTSNLRTITLGNTSSYPRQSPAERVYIVGNPVSFCLTGNSLVRFTGTVTVATPSIPASGTAMLLDNLVVANSSFNYSVGNLRANALVTINLAIQRAASSGATETLLLDHEVWVRNVQ
jgi:MSHA biogenesis protein MshO